MSLIQDKKSAFWFYRFVSMSYDRLNAPFWNQSMRSQALELAKLNRSDLMVLDVGAGTGFTTEGLIENVNPTCVTMLDQSPHQLEQARQKASLSQCKKLLGDAENLPFPTDTFDRYISAGSIEYWPKPQQAIAEAYRVLKPGGIALIVGPLQRRNVFARWFSSSWMLFPSEADYCRWYKQAGFTAIQKTYLKPDWYNGSGESEYAIAIAGTKLNSGGSRVQLPSHEEITQRLNILPQRIVAVYSSVLGAIAGLLFIPLALLFEGGLLKTFFLM